MKYSEALKLWIDRDQSIKNMHKAREACRVAGLDEAEQVCLMALQQRLKELTGKPVVLGC